MQRAQVGVVMDDADEDSEVKLRLVDGSVTGRFHVSTLTEVSEAEIAEFGLARWVAQKGAFAKIFEGQVGVVMEYVGTDGYHGNQVRLRLADGTDWIDIDTLVEASEADYEALSTSRLPASMASAGQIQLRCWRSPSLIS